MKKKALVSVIVVNFNGKVWLKKCLESIYKQDYINIEVIFVDNASDDESVSYVNDQFPRTKVIINKKNLGFAQGNNIGYKNSKGKYLLLLNTDTQIPRSFISKMVSAIEEVKEVGIIQPKILLMNKKTILDNSGSFWTDSTFLYHYGYGKKSSNKKYNNIYPVFSVKGAAMMIKREVVEKIGLFDERFWNYYEETDFCHRAWIAGYKSLYCPVTVCYHAMGGTSLEYFSRSYIQFHNFKNKLSSFIKNFETQNLIVNLPKFILLNFIIGGIWILQGNVNSTLSLVKAIIWNINNIQDSLIKRKRIQRLRKFSDKEISQFVKINPNLGYYKLLLADKVSEYED